MSVESALSSVIEIAVGIGGFAGIIAAIRQRNVSYWPADQRLLLQMLLTASAVAVLFSLTPWMLAEAWPFLVGLVGILANGFTFFLRLLFSGTADKEDAA